jgi:phosphatidylinositol-3-phosphatase
LSRRWPSGRRTRTPRTWVTCCLLVPLLLSLTACQSARPAAAVATVVRSVAGAGSVPAALRTAISPPPTPGNGGIPAFSHVFVIVLENAGFQQVVHGGAMPYLNHLGASYSVATQYFAITHPSLPNYLALLGGSTFGITSDCVTCGVDAPNLVDQLTQHGKTWKAYMEGMPGACSSLPQWPPGRYAKKHNPFLYFANIRNNAQRCRNDVPYSAFAPDLASRNVPDFVWITPDLCHDGHDCSLAQSDQWLAAQVPSILDSSAFRQGGVLFITFDEGADGSTAGCCHLAAGGQVFTLVASPLARPGAQISVPYDHYSLLRTIEDAWKLPYLGGAGDPATTNMAACFVASP